MCDLEVLIADPQVGVTVMDDPEAHRVRGFELVTLDPSRLVQPLDRHRWTPPLVLSVGDHIVCGGPDDHVRRATQLLFELPSAALGEIGERRHVCVVALDRAAVDPSDDRRDLLVGQGRVVRVVLNAYGSIDVPGRHLASLHLGLHQRRVKPGVFISEQRHRRERTGPVAFDTVLIENGRHVPRERELLRSGGCDHGWGHEYGQKRQRVRPSHSSHDCSFSTRLIAQP